MLTDNLLTIPDYILYRHDRQTLKPGSASVTKKGGGLAVYIKKEFHVDATALAYVNKSNEDIELQCLVMRPPCQKRFILLNIYRPPSGNFQNFLDTLTDILEIISMQETLETFVMGDFNLDILDQQNQNASSLVVGLQDFGFSQKIVNSTRHSKNNPSSLIDHIYTDSKCITESGNITLNVSDHDLVYTIRKKSKSEKTKLSFKGRSYRYYEKDLFQERLGDRNWDLFYSSNNVDQAWDLLLSGIRTELDSMCPLKDIRIKKQKDPWITNDILELINDKNDLLSEAKESNNPEAWDNARTARNLLNNMIKEAKRNFLTNEIENNQDPKIFWKRLHTMFPDKPISGKINLVNSHNGHILGEQEIPEYANDFFTSIGSNIVQETGFNMDEWFFEGTTYPQTFTLDTIEIESVLAEIKKLKISKPSGLEYISTKIIKDALWTLAHQFTWLLNKSVRDGKIPLEWKKAKISLIPKDGDLTDIGNFRPIAILPVVSKVIEHLIQAQTMAYLENNDILDVNQGGFRKNNSTTATTSSLLDDIYKNMNNKQLSYSIFIDFRKAFDSINHEILLKKLENLGFVNSSINWFQDYLTNRTQYTVVNGLDSSLLDINCGVPQGSVLGPMLFLLFINDLSFSIKSSGYKLYADDTVLYSKCTHESDDTLKENLQQDLNNVSHWCARNAILMNVKKTKSMMFGSRQKLKDLPQPDFYVNQRQLECVPSYKYLGTFLDSELNFIKQSNETIKSISYKLYYLGKIKTFLNSDTLLRLYKSYIQPYFDYNDIFLETTTARQYSKLVTLQRRCLRRCLPDNVKIDRNDIYRITGVNKLSDRSESHLLKIMYKRAQNDVYLEPNEGRTRLYDAPVLHVPFPNNEIFKKSVIFRGSNLWNNLSSNERNTPTFDRFKSLLKEKLTQKLV